MAQLAFQSARDARLHHDVAWQIGRHIIAGELSPGTTVPAESVLIREFDVSRAVVREALRSLSQRGLVAMRQGRRTVVLPPDAWDVLDPMVLAIHRELGCIHSLIDDFFRVRRILEPEVAAEAARHADPGLIADLAACIERSAALVGEPDAFLDEDMVFHHRLVAATGNRILARMYATIGDFLHVSREITNQLPNSLPDALAWHRRIYAAIAARDPDAARGAMVGHLDWTASRL